MHVEWEGELDEALARLAQSGVTYREAAETLGVTRAAVAGRVRRAGVRWMSMHAKRKGRW